MPQPLVADSAAQLAAVRLAAGLEPQEFGLGLQGFVRARGHLMADAAQPDRVGRAYVNGLLVHVVVFMGADDVRNQDEYGLSFRVVGG